MTQEPAATATLLAIRSVLDCTRRFPQRVFVGAWRGFFFFDSDHLFRAEFVGWVKSLLRTEGGAYVCIVDLDTAQNADALPSSWFIIKDTTPSEAYQTFLVGSSKNLGWIYTADRFACISDKGGWCIYCERRNEIAVVALRSERLGSLVDEVNGRPIEEALAMPFSYGFTDRVISPEWRIKLMGEYACSEEM